MAELSPSIDGLRRVCSFGGMAKEGTTGCFTKIAAGFALLIAFKMCSSALGGSDSTPSTTVSAPLSSAAQQPAASAAPAPQEKIERVSADALVRAYESNEIATDTKYKGRHIIVTGPVGMVSDGMLGPTVTVGTSINSVLASGLSRQFAGSLKKGEPVELTCKATGSMLGSPTLDCAH